MLGIVNLLSVSHLKNVGSFNKMVLIFDIKQHHIDFLVKIPIILLTLGSVYYLESFILHRVPKIKYLRDIISCG